MSTEQLRKGQLIVTICSAIAVPLLIAYFGWKIQDTIASRQLAKEYVAMSINVLQTRPKQVDSGMRRWATQILATYSPVPLPPGLRETLETKEPLVSYVPLEVNIPVPIMPKVPEELLNCRLSLPEPPEFVGMEGKLVLPPDQAIVLKQLIHGLLTCDDAWRAWSQPQP